MNGPQWVALLLFALGLQAVGGCARPANGDLARENALIAARIDHRLGTQGDRAHERMAFTRRRLKTERVVCVAVTRDQGPAARFIYRSGCLFGESDLSPPVFDRWRRDFCENS